MSSRNDARQSGLDSHMETFVGVILTSLHYALPIWNEGQLVKLLQHSVEILPAAPQVKRRGYG